VAGGVRSQPSPHAVLSNKSLIFQNPLSANMENRGRSHNLTPRGWRDIFRITDIPMHREGLPNPLLVDHIATEPLVMSSDRAAAQGPSPGNQ
jgi:hypothetical protein